MKIDYNKYKLEIQVDRIPSIKIIITCCL